MKLLVCIKKVPDDSVSVSVGADGNIVFSEDTIIVNELDAYALEMAVRLKEATGGQVTVLTTGCEADSAPVLRSCLSVGADRAYVVQNTDENCPRSSANALSQAAQTIEDAPYDVIFCGVESSDLSSGQVGVRLAKELGVPVVTNVVSVEKNGDHLLTKQDTPVGYRMIEVVPPCVITVAKPPFEPRYPSIKSKMAARKIPIGTVLAEGPSTETGSKRISIADPSQKRNGVLIQDETADIAVRRALELMAERKII